MGNGPSFPIIQLNKEKIVIVTGGNTGIGYQTAKWVAMMGATVIIACRSEEKAKTAIEKMNRQFKKERQHTDGLTREDSLFVEYMHLDLASLKSVMSFIEEFKASGRKLNTLICNAGIGPYPKTMTEDGNEMIFQVNYLGHFLMVAHLLPIMMRSGTDCRIVMVSSRSHSLTANLDLTKIQGTEYSQEDFPSHTYYGNSKLYQIMHMYSLNRRIKKTNVTITSVHPGFVNTGFNRAFHDRCCIRCLWGCAMIFPCSKSTFDGATTVINAVVNPRLARVRDAYLIKTKQKVPSDESRNGSNQEHLWDYTLELLKPYIPDDIKEYLEGRRTS